MVDTQSPTAKFFRGVGFVIGKGIRYFVIGGFIYFVGAKFGGSKPPQPVPNPPPPTP